MSYSVKIFKDSINDGNRLTTFELTYPRFVHAELMTHRQFSRNSASSRAIPTEKLIEQVMNDPAMPLWWGKNQSGMQAREELNAFDQERAKTSWLNAREEAVRFCRALHGIGLHKQIANRIIEPWMFITVIVSATEYENFFHLRCHPDAQPEIRWVAEEMRRQREESKPQRIAWGDWHLPLVELSDKESPLYVSPKDTLRVARNIDSAFGMDTLIKISVARCARVSYLTHDGKRDYQKDIELHDRLVKSGHWSPFEHVATPAAGSHGNLVGWKQYRKHFAEECVGRELF